MKKLICALVLLAMLVPVVAMAEIPPVNTEGIPTVNYDQGPGKSGRCMAEFGANGVLRKFMPGEGCTAEHDIKSPVTVKLVTGEAANKPADNVNEVAESYG